MEENLNKFSKVKLWSILIYLPFFNIFFCLIASVKFADNQFVRFHLRQGIILFGMIFVSLFVILFKFYFGLFLFFILLILHIVGILSVFTDTFLILPIIGQLANKIPEFYLYRVLTGKDPSESWLSKDE